MYGMYLLRKEEMQLAVNSGANGVDEMLLYHVTTKSRALESLKSGLDWRRTQRSRYGCGVSFSDDAEYADKYADNSTGEGIIIYLLNITINLCPPNHPLLQSTVPHRNCFRAPSKLFVVQ